MKITKRGRILIEPTTRALSKQQKEDIVDNEIKELKTKIATLDNFINLKFLPDRSSLKILMHRACTKRNEFLLRLEKIENATAEYDCLTGIKID